MSEMDIIENWPEISTLARQHRVPVVVMVDQLDCPYCRIVEGEYFAAIFASGEFDDRAIFGKISLDAGKYIINESGRKTATRKFLEKYKANLTPTILFLDSEQNQLVEKMVGLLTPDYYLYYLEAAIKKAHQLVTSS